MENEIDEFLLELLRSRSPTGTEREAADVVEKYVGSAAAGGVKRDVLGNRYAMYGDGEKVLMLSGHMDEIGFIVSYIDDDGFLFFEQLGGHDNVMLPGRRVAVITKAGYVYGVTGKRAVHLMDAKERKEVPETFQVWIDIGATSRAEAEKLVRIGDPVVYDTAVRKLSRTRYSARAFDDRAGCYCVFEALRSGGAVFVVFLAILALLFIQNTIRMTIQARNTEIAIMRSVGASNWYIRGPFILEGMYIGVLGSIIPIVLISCGYYALYQAFDGVLLSSMFVMKPMWPFIFGVCLILLLGGILVGMAGSFLAVGKYLRWKR